MGYGMKTGILGKALFKIGWYQNRVEGPNKFGVTRNRFGRGRIMGVWGGGVTPAVEENQLRMLEQFESARPSAVKRLLDGIHRGKISFQFIERDKIKQALMTLTKAEEYKDLAGQAYQTLFQPIKEVRGPAAPVVPQKVQLPPTEAEFYAKDCPLEVLLYVRATGQLQEEKIGSPGMIKEYASTFIKERVNEGIFSLEQIAKFIDSASNAMVICGAIKAIGDLKPASIGGKPVEAFLEGLRDLAPKSAIGDTAAAVLREAFEKEPPPKTLPPRPKVPTVSPPPAEEVLKPVEAPKEELIDFEEVKTTPVPTMRAVAETTPETVLKYLQDEVSYLVQQDARLRQSLSEVEKNSDDLKKLGGERTKAVASLKTIIEEQSELYKEQLAIAEANYQSSINVEEIKKLQAQIKTAETETGDLIQAAILKETLSMAVDPLREEYEEQRTEITARMNQALRLTERNAWINAQEREIASIKAGLEKLSAQKKEIEAQLAANQDDAQALFDRIDGYVKKMQVQKNALSKILPKTEIGKKS